MSRLTPHISRLLALILAIAAATGAYALHRSHSGSPSPSAARADAPRYGAVAGPGEVTVTKRHDRRNAQPHHDATRAKRTERRQTTTIKPLPARSGRSPAARPTTPVRMEPAVGPRTAPAPPVRHQGRKVAKHEPVRKGPTITPALPAPAPPAARPAPPRPPAPPQPSAPAPPPSPAPAAAPPAAAQPPAPSAPVATPPPAADPAPTAGTPDPEASLDDTGLGTLDTTGLPGPIDETAPATP